uniref:G_PROTEIN_RECEP_F1_2 domain-containing protein n=1 Tax=Strongyloides venezuelensis TaxID=75913 RepID=A0A0K0FJB9_STRVS
MVSQPTSRIYTLLPYAILAVFGLISTIYALYKIKVIQKFQSPFGFLLKALFSNVLLYLVTILFWIFIRVVFEENDLMESYSRYIGIFFLFTWYFSEFTAVVISSNRFIAIAFPIYYRNEITNGKTKIIVGAISIVALCISMASLIESCSISYSTKTLTWGFPNSWCGKLYAFWLQFIGGIVFIIINSIIDISTLLLLIRRKQHSTVLKTNDKKHNSIVRQDVLFFFQSCLQNIKTLIIVVSINVFTRLIDSIYGKFYFRTFSWCLCYVLDVVIIIFFNKELWRLNKCRPISEVKIAFQGNMNSKQNIIN